MTSQWLGGEIAIDIHCDITMGGEIAIYIHSDITIDGEIAIDTHCDITMGGEIAVIIISFIQTCIKIHTFQLLKKRENTCF